MRLNSGVVDIEKKINKMELNEKELRLLNEKVNTELHLSLSNDAINDLLTHCDDDEIDIEDIYEASEHSSVKKFQPNNLWPMLHEKILNTDIRKLGIPATETSISSAMSKPVYKLEHCLFCQIMNIKNINMPLHSSNIDTQNDNSSTRLLLITLHDGTQKLKAMEYVSCKKLNIEIPPGTKLLLVASTNNPITFKNGIILLEPSKFHILGGCVNRLMSNWEASRKVVLFRATEVGAIRSHRISNTGEGPPKFISFNPNIRTSPAHEKNQSTQKNTSSVENDTKSSSPQQQKTRFTLQEVGGVSDGAASAIPKQKLSKDVFQPAEKPEHHFKKGRERKSKQAYLDKKNLSEFMVQRNKSTMLLSDAIFAALENKNIPTTTTTTLKHNNNPDTKNSFVPNYPSIEESKEYQSVPHNTIVTPQPSSYYNNNPPCSSIYDNSRTMYQNQKNEFSKNKNGKDTQDYSAASLNFDSSHRNTKGGRPFHRGRGRKRY